MKNKYYTLNNILKKGAVYNVIFGERSSGKTYAVLKYALERFVKHGEQLGIVRRWREDFTGKRGATMWAALEENGEIKKITGGEWTSIYYYSSRWYLCSIDEAGKRVIDETPLAYGFSISSMEHDKSTSFPRIKTIMFDEFLSRTAYLPDEFVLFMNVLSTIIRDRKDIKIFMLGNAVNKYCPYFSEMGLQHIKKMKPGDIDLYKYGSSGLTVAVEYTTPNKRGKESDLYFAFDNPRLQMITGGAWEIDIYPHCPVKIRPKDIIFKYYIIFSGDALECDVVLQNNLSFTFIHRKTTEIPEDSLVYTQEFSPLPNYRRKITACVDNIDKRILQYYKQDKIFYADNEVGEIVRNYIIWCGGKAK